MGRMLLLAALFAATAATSVRAGDSEVEATLAKLSMQVAEAILKGDRNFLDDITHDDWLLIVPTGEVIDRARAKEGAQLGPVKFLRLNKTVDKVRVFGDMAVVTGHQSAKRLIRGQEVGGDESFTEVYVKDGGKWRCASVHLSLNVPGPK